jgi:Sulfotransferase family
MTTHLALKSEDMRTGKSVSPIYGMVLLLVLIRVGDQIRRDQKRFAGPTLHSDEFIVPHDTRSLTAPTHLSSNERNSNELLVKYGDSIYLTNDWDGAPVVLEQYKLVFFTTPKIGCTTWKQLFRRMMGIKNWNVEEYSKMLPWNPQLNGLKYLYDYDRETANAIMTDPQWTRAIFVRDPKERFLSAYLDKGKTNPTYIRHNCCAYTGKCVAQAKESLAGFLQVAYYCDNGHWRPQHVRMEAKYWPYINYVGRMETLSEDAEILLKQVGAWDDHGSTGWGPHGNQSVFSAQPGGSGSIHATHARKKLQTYLTPELEAAIDEYYAEDYFNPVLNLARIKVFA